MRTMDFNSRPHGGRLKKADFEKLLNISTHALTEGDHSALSKIFFAIVFQLTPSRRATRPDRACNTVRHIVFQLTPSRRATNLCPASVFFVIHFNSRPHGGRLSCRRWWILRSAFQLTPSRRATIVCSTPIHIQCISTHALTEGDWPRMYQAGTFCYFNSRPHGGRRCFCPTGSSSAYFNSRPHGGRQTQGGNTEKSFCISTHALTEGDRVFYNTGSVLHDFNSRPHGGRLSFADSISPNRSFQLTPSRRATSSLHMYSASRRFQLTPSRRATSSQLVYQVSISISTHALTEGDFLEH